MWPVFASFALSIFMLFWRLGGMALITPDEGRNAEVAREMRLSHAWLVPTYDGLAYLDKPAFYFKTVALSFAAFGESEGVARLSSALFALALIGVVFLFCKKMYDQRTAVLAVIVVSTTPLFLVFARYVIFDMTLAFFVCSSIFACFLAEEDDGKHRTRWYLLAALAAGVATVIKGPVGFIIPTLVIAVFNALEGRFAVMKQAFALRNVAIFLAIVLPWFIGLSIERPDFPYYGIMRESIARFTTTEFRRTAPFYFYAPIIMGTFFAWSLLLPASVLAAIKNRSRWSRTDRLLVVWAIVVVIFFSISKSKLPGYILSGVLALGILTARVFALALANHAGRAAQLLRRSTIPLLVLSVLAAGVLFWLAADPAWLKSKLSDKHAVFDLFVPSIMPMAWSFAAVAVLSGAALWTRNTRVVFAAFMSFPVLLISVNFDLLSVYAHTRSSRALAEHIRPLINEASELACLECLPNGLPFYLQRYVTVITRDGEELTSNYVVFTLKSDQPWPARVVPLANVQQWLAQRTQPVYLLAKTDHLQELKAIAATRGVTVTEQGSKYWAALLPAPTGR
ncbi:MAG: glycosyltransferase family 39 protein [Methylococcaceae bacterium]|nr:glycosyltransferase family 39 protein [Methylococcaceae bacterium]